MCGFYTVILPDFAGWFCAYPQCAKHYRHFACFFRAKRLPFAQEICYTIGNQAVCKGERFSQEINEKIHVSIFPDGAEIVEDYRGNYDIILMDILMRYMDGMEAASEIRKVDKEVVILFITSTPKYVMKGYTVDALDYVLKPVSYFAFSQRMQRALERMKHRTRKFISVPFQGGMRKLDISQIRYIEVVNHSLIYHLDGETLEAKGVLSELEEALTAYHFFRCNKCYLVNLEHVNGVNENCADVDGDQIQVSRPKKKAFLDALNNYINEVGK